MMKKISISLWLIFGGLYGWGQYQHLLSESDLDAMMKVQPPKEVFPNSMQRIQPLSVTLEEMEKEHLERLAQKRAQEEAQKKEAEEKALQEKLEQEKLAQAEAERLQKEKERLQISCVKIGSFTPKQLPQVNQALKQYGLLEKVKVSPVFGSDRYVVFIIPTTTLKGAQALVKQLKDQGYNKAQAITAGPLTNATQLNIFDNEADAVKFMETAKEKLNMKEIRMTRLMGEASGDVMLTFEDLTEKEKEQLKKIALQNKKELMACLD